MKIYPHLKKRFNNRGVVFITVTMITLIITFIAISLISLITSSVRTAEDEYRRIQAKTLAEGVIALVVAEQQKPSPPTTALFTQPLDGINYSVNWTLLTTSDGIFNTDNVQIRVLY